MTEIIIVSLFGLLIFLATNFLGSITKVVGYVSTLDYAESEHKSFNIAFRILAPVALWSAGCLLIYNFVPALQTDLLWTAIPLAWFFRFTSISIYERWQSLSMELFISQALLSSVLAYYFSSTILMKDPSLLIPTPEDASFQMWLNVFIVAIMIISNSASSEHIQTRSQAHLERKLYVFRQRFSHLFTPKIREDLLLQVVIYSIMLCEDYNRPFYVRKLENLAFKFHLSKTTGIMQTKSKAPLSDEESVREALPIIEEIWGDFLLKRCRRIETNKTKLGNDSSEQEINLDQDGLILSEDGCCYSFNSLSHIVAEHFPSIYSRYVGTQLISTEPFFEASRNFIIKEEYLDHNDLICIKNVLEH